MAYTSQQFIDLIWPFVKKYAHQYNIMVASPVLAQAVIESGNGNSGLAKYNNFFGLKCGRSWKGKSVNMKTKEEYQPGVLTDVSANFRAYDSVEEGIKGYFEFLQYSRYSNLKGETNPRAYIEKIKADGYATSSTYVDTVWNTVLKLDLQKYDKMLSEVEEDPNVESVLDISVIDSIYVKDGRLHVDAKDLTDLKNIVSRLETMANNASKIEEVLKCLK